MLQDHNLDDVIDAFEAGYGEAAVRHRQPSPCPFGAGDPVRRIAWIDGVSFNAPAALPPLRFGESPCADAFGIFRPIHGAAYHPSVVTFCGSGPRLK